MRQTEPIKIDTQSTQSELTLILAGGGLRSLVATAAARSSVAAASVRLLHLRDHRTNDPPRRKAARLQAKHYGIERLIELELPNLGARHGPDQPREMARVALHSIQLLTIALAQAAELGVSRIVWPAQVDADFDRCAALTEQAVLLQTAARHEFEHAAEIESPLLELDDQQVIELGGQLEVPWETAWSCLLQGDHPCRVCAACRRRHTAFDAAGVVDPIDETAPAR